MAMEPLTRGDVVILVLTDGRVIDTIVQGLPSPLFEKPPQLAESDCRDRWRYWRIRRGQAVRADHSHECRAAHANFEHPEVRESVRTASLVTEREHPTPGLLQRAACAGELAHISPDQALVRNGFSDCDRIVHRGCRVARVTEERVGIRVTAPRNTR